MDVQAVRLRRLRRLVKEYGSQTELAGTIGRSPNYISRILSGVKKLGEKLAREIETGTGKPNGWLDQEDGEGLAVARGAPTAKAQWPFKIDFRRFDSLPVNNKNMIGVVVERMILEFEDERETRPKRRKAG